MAQLDPLLRALVDRGASELVLADGERPSLRYGEELRPVSPAALSSAQVAALLTELATGIDAAQLGEDGPSHFVYRPNGGPAFECTLVRRAGRVHARLALRPAPDPGEAHKQAPAQAPAPTPEPSSVATPRPARPAESAGTDAAARAPEIEGLLRQMVELGASDLHLSAGEVPRLRLHGQMTAMPDRPAFTAGQTLELLKPITPEHNLTAYLETHDTDFAWELPGQARFRVNVFTDRNGPGAVLRVIPARILTTEELGLPEVVLRLCEMPRGLVLVTGPTGSGKSTTLAAMIDHINRTRTDHIITIEDPIEFVHGNRKCLINQREIHAHTAGFKQALRAALREDPDIVLVGEMRDLETVAIAIETAETGHLVFGTLHTSTACSTVDRIIDQFPADRQAQIRTMLSESLRGVISQVLVRRAAGGRAAALEILMVTPAISNLIREGKTFQIPSLMQTGKKQGMRLLNEALLDLVREKAVEPDEAYLKAVDKASFASQLAAAGFRLTIAAGER